MHSLAAVATSVLVMFAAFSMPAPDAPPMVHSHSELCFGEAPTILGSPGGEVGGTAGRDVVITNGAAYVAAGAGDDLVCVTGDAAPFLKTGAGNDRIDASATRRSWNLTVNLGAGADEFLGGPARDSIRANGTGEDDADRIKTAGGRDSVSTGGRDTNNDVIRLGSEADAVYVSRTLPQPVIHGGRGADGLFMFLNRSRVGSWRIDNRTRQMTADRVVAARWTSFSRFEPSIPGSATFIGGAGREFLSIAIEERPSLQIHLGAEDDRLQVFGRAPGGRLDGGAGKDSISVVYTATDGSVSLNLERGRFVAAAPGEHAAMSALHFENAALRGEAHLMIRGTDGPNHLHGHAEVSPISLYGLGGNDRLEGGGGNDILIGGPGHDVADGSFGIDRCDSEVREILRTMIDSRYVRGGPGNR